MPVFKQRIKSMIFLPTKLQDVCEINLNKIGDDRGFFARSFCIDEFNNAGLESNFVQQNISKSSNLHTLRGLHYQVGAYAENKFIRCHKGSILDVIIDIRKNSPSFLLYETFEKVTKRTELSDMKLIKNGCDPNCIELTVTLRINTNYAYRMP